MRAPIGVRRDPIGSAPSTPPRTPARPPVGSVPNPGAPVETYKADKEGLDMHRSKAVDLNPGKKLMKTMGNYQFNTAYQGIVSNNNGLQALGTAELILCRDQMIGTVDQSRSVVTKFDTDLFKLNPFFQVPASTYYTVPADSVVNMDVLGVKSVDVQMRYVSLKSFPQEVEVLWCMPKIDLEENAQQTWERILSDKSMHQAAQAPQSNINTATAAGGAPVSNEIGQIPTKHKEWRKLWRVVKHYKLALQSGEQINITTKIKYNKVIAKTTLNSRTHQYQAGITIYPLIIARGALVGVRTAVGVEATEVTFGAPKIGFVFNYSFKLAALGQQRLKTERTYRGYLVNTVNPIRTINDEETVIDPELVAHEV